MKIDRGRQTILALFGLSAGVAGGLWLWRRQSTALAEPEWRWGLLPRGSAQGVAGALAADPKLARRGIEVDTIAEGVVELTGTVRDRGEMERAVGVAQRTTGVYTVVNRLVVDAEESHRNETRRRWTEGAPDLRERHHYGMGVGMGTRRQSPTTDPDRPSDKQKMLDRELDVGNVEDEPAAPPRPPNSASRVESTDVKPGDARAIGEAGLNPQGESAPDEERPGENGRTGTGDD